MSAQPSPVVPNDIKILVPDPTNSLCGNFVNVLLQLPKKVYLFLGWMLDAAGNITQTFRRQIIPPGGYHYAAGPSQESAALLLCNGQLVNRVTYAELFAVIGTSYGVGDGVTTFQLPDHRARFPVGVGSFPSATPIAVGTTGGEETVKLLEGNLPIHKHLLCADEDATNAGKPTNDDAVAYRSHNTLEGGDNFKYTLEKAALPATEATLGKSSKTGSDTPHNNLPPYIGVFTYIWT